MSASEGLDVERVVRERYGNAANEREAALCCPIDYDPRYLSAIPGEVLERDYGCGDPSRYLRPGDTVLDLGSGGGKICFIASQIVGSNGRVLGVDVNDEMLSLARRAAPDVAERIGYANVEFLRGRIQDLKLPLDRLDKWLANHPVQSAADLTSLDNQVSRLRGEEPLIPDASVDIVISNCVLNLVHSDHKRQLIEEIYRVLVRGGRIAISDIVSDEEVPQEMRDNPELWSGCISGAFKEDGLLLELGRAGFYGIRVDVWSEEPFQVVDGIEFRSVTVTAHKGLEGPCLEGLQGVIYRGPWSEVRDDDGHVLRRGERTAVCEKTFEILTGEPYTDAIIPIPARVEIPEHEHREFDRSRTEPRHPKETKGAGYALTTETPSGCEPSDSCC